MKLQSGWNGHNAVIVDPTTGEAITVGDCIINIDVNGISKIVEADPYIFACGDFLSLMDKIPPKGVIYARDGLNFAVQTDSASVGYEMLFQLFDRDAWVCALKFYLEHAN